MCSWIEKLRSERSLNFYSPTNDQIITLEKFELYLVHGDLRAKTTFMVVKTLSVKNFIGTYFMNKYATSIYPSERKLKPLCSKLIAIVLTEALDNLAVATTSTQHGKEHNDSNNFRQN